MPGGDRLGLRSLLRTVPGAVRRDYAATLAVQFLVLGVGLLLFHLVARRGGVDGFAFYQIARGLVTTLQPALLLGLGIALYRYLPHAGRRARRLTRQAWHLEAALVAVVTLAGIAAGEQVAALLGMPGGRSAVTAALIMLGGNCLCTISLAALRGNGQAAASNLTLGIGFGVTPPAAFAAADRIEDFLIIQGLATAIVGAGAMLAVRSGPGPAATPEPDIKTLISYGVHRMPGELALPGFYTLPTLAVAVTMPGSPQAGYVGFTTSAVTLICSVFAMLTPVLMPRISRLARQPAEHRGVRRLLTVLPLLAAAAAAVPTAVVAGFAPLMVRKFLGGEFGDAIPVLRLGVLAAVPLAMFYAARPALDTLVDATVVSRLLVSSLLLQCVTTALGTAVLPPPHAAMLGLITGAIALGCQAAGRAAHALRRRPA
jgi:O-antigen/teichoic acid export membrane protein